MWRNARISEDATDVVEENIERKPSSYAEVPHSLPRGKIMNSRKYRYQEQIDDTTATTIEMVISIDSACHEEN